MSMLKIGIIFGGVGEEHDVSIKSAREVAKNLDPDKYEPYWIGITTEGAWLLCDSPNGDWQNDDFRKVVLSPDRRLHGLLIEAQGRYETVRLDIVFPVLHGKSGEDGSIQGLLELSGIPYIGCDIQSSVLCMDKSLAYTVARSAGIATPDFWVIDQDDVDRDDIDQDRIDRNDIERNEKKVDADQLPYPVFVKPARSGSSFGVSKVARADELSAALQSARQYDTKVLIEQAVPGREIGCAILGEYPELIAGEVDHVALSHGFFRIHQEDSPETGSQNSEFRVPADVPDESRRLVQETAKTIYRVLGCRGLARVDMFLTDDGKVVLNEVNTLPGLTSYSRYPRMMAAAGISLASLIDRLVSTALDGKQR